MPEFAGDTCDYRRTAGTGAPAHTGGDEHHIQVLHRFEDFVERFFGCGAPDIGAGPGAEPAGNADPQLDFAVGGRLLHRLRIRIADDELTPDQIRADHIVDGVSPGAAYPDNSDSGLHLLLVPRDAQIDHMSSTASQPQSCPEGSGLPPLLADIDLAGFIRYR